MTNGFGFDDRTRRYTESFQLEEIPHIDPQKFEPIERAAIERLVTEQQESLVRLQTDVLDVRTERNALESQLTELEDQREQLRDRISELETQRPSLEPKEVFSNLGAAFEEVNDDLAGERYRVDDVDFTLKANVIQTQEGMRMHLPSLDEPSASANLSEISFRLRAPRAEAERTGSEYVEVPDLRGLARETATRRLAEEGLTEGTVETVARPESRPGTVVEQFPGPHSVAEPEAPVDLVLAAEPEPDTDESASETETPGEADSADTDVGSETDEDTPTDHDDRDGSAEPEAGAESGADEAERIEAFRKAIVESDVDDPATVIERLQRAGVDDVESLIDRDARELAERLSVPFERIVALQQQLSDRDERIALEEVQGIGPTYAERLREAGIGNVTQLATRDPETVTEITGASTSRTKDWIEQASELVGRR